MTREDKVKQLHETYGWDLKALKNHNDAQIDTLYSACLDEEGNLRKKERKVK